MAKIATFYDHMVDIARQESLSVVEALKLAREMGIEAVEASGNNIVGREDEFGQEIAMADLGISSIPSFFHFDEDQDVEKQAAPILEAAQFLGADRLLVIPGFLGGGRFPSGPGGKDPADDPLRGPAGGAGPPLWGFPW